MTIASTVSAQGLTLFLDGQLLVATNAHPNFDQIMKAYTEQRYADIPGLIDLATGIKDYIDPETFPEFNVVAGRISIDGYTFNESVSRTALQWLRAGAPAEPLRLNLQKIAATEDWVLRNELVLFHERNGFMISENGDFVAWKGVRDTYFDVHSNTIFNEVGRTISMPRGEVNNNRQDTCAPGLHVTSRQYAEGWGQRLLLVKVDPRNVVMIPNDYSTMKFRCCEYEILAEVPKDQQLPPRAVWVTDELRPTPAPVEPEPVDYTKLARALVQEIAVDIYARVELTDDAVTLRECDLNSQHIDDLEVRLDNALAPNYVHTLWPDTVLADVYSDVVEALQANAGVVEEEKEPSGEVEDTDWHGRAVDLVQAELTYIYPGTVFDDATRTLADLDLRVSEVGDLERALHGAIEGNATIEITSDTTLSEVYEQVRQELRYWQS